MMARTEYRLMSLLGRGLLYSMRLECWVNGRLPSQPPKLARVLGFDLGAVETALPEVMPFFVSCDDSFRCPELDDYRAHLEDRRQRQSKGGLAGAAKTNGARTSNPTGTPRVARESLAKPRQDKNSQAKRLQGQPSTDPWVSEYERASRGS